MKDIEEIIRIGNRARADMETAEILPEGFELKDSYPLNCPYCDKSLVMQPGLFMQMGMNMGGGQCLGCSKHFQIRIDTRENTAVGICMEVPGA